MPAWQEGGRAMDDDRKFFHLVTFEMNSEMFAIPIMNIQEIIRWTSVVPVPQAPAFVEGVINLRGRIIPVVSLKKKFGVGEERAADDKSRIVIAEIGSLVVGFVVDGVHEVLRVDKNAFEDTPAIAVTDNRRCVKGIVKQDKQMIMVLWLEELFSMEEKGVLGRVN
jgi:purine-binding chemotaxis protein CheW